MSILGLEGRLQLTREYPDPEHFKAVDLNGRISTLQSRDTAYWSGDRVVAYCARGLPTVKCPTGMAQWFGVGDNVLPDTRAHITADADPFWKDDDTAEHWESFESDGVVQQWYYIHVDEFDRISFYDNQEDALAARNRIPMPRVAFGDLMIAAATTGALHPERRGQCLWAVRFGAL